MQRVALMGLGVMGSGMAGQLLEHGFALTVYNRTPARAAALERRGAQVASSAAGASGNADVVLSMVADDKASREVWLGEMRALSAARPGTVIVECSTLSPGWVRELGRAAGEHKCEFLDAPVTGSKSHAASGELAFLVGGDAATLERARPVLQAMSRKVIHVGASGSGALLKLINNYLCGVQAASLAEALALIERSGLNRDSALEILNNGAPGSPLMKALSARMTARIYEVNFALELMQKDLQYAGQEAAEHSVEFRTGKAAEQLFREARQRGWEGKDFSSVAEALR